MGDALIDHKFFPPGFTVRDLPRFRFGDHPAGADGNAADTFLLHHPAGPDRDLILHHFIHPAAGPDWNLVHHFFAYHPARPHWNPRHDFLGNIPAHLHGTVLADDFRLIRRVRHLALDDLRAIHRPIDGEARGLHPADP